jgi:hypothetical protein
MIETGALRTLNLTESPANILFIGHLGTLILIIRTLGPFFSSETVIAPKIYFDTQHPF